MADRINSKKFQGVYWRESKVDKYHGKPDSVYRIRNNQDQKPVGFLKFLSRKLPSILFAISTNLFAGIENKIMSSGTKFLAIVSISPIIHCGYVLNSAMWE